VHCPTSCPLTWSPVPLTICPSCSPPCRLLLPTEKIQQLQLMLLAVEGVVVCAAVVAWMWVLLQRVAGQRYSLFSVFLVRGSHFLRQKPSGSPAAVSWHPLPYMLTSSAWPVNMLTHWQVSAMILFASAGVHCMSS
jgi:hypothetical protein